MRSRGSANVRSSDSLWAITCHFNPSRSSRRVANFRSFRGRLGVRLLAVEMSGNGRFELEEGDADVLLRLQGGDVLWQKERLLNVALRALPGECDLVAWLDGDIVFTDPDWPERVAEGLRRHALVQVFDRLVEPGPEEPLAGVLETAHRFRCRRAVTSGLEDGRYTRDVFGRLGGSLALGYTPGHGWAARRSLLERFGLYDAFILGTGDKAIAAAAYGETEAFLSSIEIDPSHEEHFRSWAEPFSKAVNGSVGHCPNTIVHLWHGDLARRKYESRYDGFGRFGFDPSVDVHPAESGAWQWRTPKPELHRYVREYLENRCEDGLSDPGLQRVR